MKKTKNKTEFEKYSIKEKILMSALTAGAMSFVFLFFGPIDIYANNMNEFAFSFMDIFGLVIVSFIIGFIAIFSLLMLLNKFLMNMATAAMFSVVLASYFDNICVNAVTVVSGDATSSVSYGDLVVSFMIYMLLVVIICTVACMFAKKWKNIVVYLSILVLAMNSASLITDFSKYKLFSDKGIDTEYALTTENINSVSEDENIIYILFDRFDTYYYEKVIEKQPDFFDDLDGFTFYDSATSMYTRTFPGVAYMISGVDYTLQCSPNDYFNSAYQDSTFLKDLQNNGYSINIYADRYYEYADAKSLLNVANNVKKVDGYTPDKKEIFKYLTELSFARSFSMTLTSVMYSNANTGRTTNLSSLNCEKEVYADNDEKFINNLRSEGLTADKKGKNYSFIYMHGCHTPFILDENCKRTENATPYSQTVGSFTAVYEYLNQLKELGVYDNSTIIIAGDHGNPYTETDDLDKQVDNGITTCMFVKPRNSKTNGLTISHAQASVADIIPTIVDDANIKTTNDYGQSLFDIKESEERTRTFYQSIYSPSKHKLCLNKYEITGDAHEISNWKKIDYLQSNYQWY